MTFRLSLPVRFDDVDSNGHVRGPALLAYADHARWECVTAAGVDPRRFQADGIGPVNLQTTLRFHRELLAGGEVEVSCEFVWGDGRTARIKQEIRRADGELCASVDSVAGLLNLATRKLVEKPGEYWRSLARTPALLGLS